MGYSSPSSLVAVQEAERVDTALTHLLLHLYYLVLFARLLYSPLRSQQNCCGLSNPRSQLSHGYDEGCNGEGHMALEVQWTRQDSRLTLAADSLTSTDCVKMHTGH